MQYLPGWSLSDEPSARFSIDGSFTRVWSDDSDLKIWRSSSIDPVLYRLQLGDLASVEINPAAHEISVFGGVNDLPQSTLHHLIADQVAPRVLAHGGQLVLHAGAVRSKDAALLFLGPSGCGKSTLVTSFQQSGWKLMGDDAVVLNERDDQAWAEAVYPSLRLFPDSIAAILPSATTRQAMAHYSLKQRVDAFADWQLVEARRVAAIFILGGDGPLTVSPISAAQSCMAMIENSFALDATDRAQALARLGMASRAAGHLAAFALTYPHDYARVGEVRAAILDALGDVPAVLD